MNVSFVCMHLSFQMSVIKSIFLFNFLRLQCLLLPTAQWQTCASTAAWRPLRCWEFCSTSLKLKTVPMILQSTLFIQVEVSEDNSTCSSVLKEKTSKYTPVCWCFRASQTKAQRLSSGAESHARSMWAGLQGFPHGRRPWRRSDIWCNGTYPSFCSMSCFLHYPHNNICSCF